MESLSSVEILLLFQDAATERRWADALSGPTCRIHFGPDTPLDPDQIDLILTDADGPVAPSNDKPGRWTPEAIEESLAGVVRIGGQGPADVRLPEDATPRELRLASGLLAQIVRLRRLVKAGAARESRLTEAALYDPVTGLPNRRAWDETLAQRLEGPARPGRRLALAVFDLDHFRRINDVHGHAMGDAVLHAAGEAFRHGLRQEDFVARLGGDEFGFLLWVPDRQTAAAVLDRVRRQLPERLARSSLPAVTASAGYWVSPAEPSPPLPSPFEAADAALRQAKREGRDRMAEAASN